MFNGYLHTKCQVSVLMHKEDADEKSGGCDFGHRNNEFSTYNKVALKKFRKKRGKSEHIKKRKV